MSGLNMENDMSYLSEMSEDDRVIFLKVLMRLAKADGNVDEGEDAFIAELMKAFEIEPDKLAIPFHAKDKANMPYFQFNE